MGPLAHKEHMGHTTNKNKKYDLLADLLKTEELKPFSFLQWLIFCPVEQSAVYHCGLNPEILEVAPEQNVHIDALQKYVIEIILNF